MHLHAMGDRWPSVTRRTRAVCVACALRVDVAWYRRRRARYRPTIPRRIKHIVAYYDGRHYADSSSRITPGLAPCHQRVAAAT